ncbi:MAG: phage major tail tube protein, partial [Alphaproteobacteria bacterium]|nr:phage major tail tube protein [Alphaproteobacteria bacterium]
MSGQVNIISNGNVYLNGVNLLGKVKSVKLPIIKAKLVDLHTLGGMMPVQLPAGFEKMEGEVEWASFDA